MSANQQCIQRAHPRAYYSTLAAPKSPKMSNETISLQSPFRLRQSALLKGKKSSSNSDSSSISKQKYRRSVPLSVKFYDIPQCNHTDEDNDERQLSQTYEKTGRYRQTIIDNIMAIDQRQPRGPIKKFQKDNGKQEKPEKMGNSRKTDVSHSKRSSTYVDSFGQSSGSFQDDDLEEQLIKELSKINAYKRQKQTQDPPAQQNQHSPSVKSTNQIISLQQPNRPSYPSMHQPPVSRKNAQARQLPVYRSNYFEDIGHHQPKRLVPQPFYQNDITVNIQDQVFIFRVILQNSNKAITYRIQSEKNYPQGRRRKYDCLDYFTIDVFIDHVIIVNDLRANPILYQRAQPTTQMRSRLKTYVPLRDPCRSITCQHFGLDGLEGRIRPLRVSWREKGRKK